MHVCILLCVCTYVCVRTYVRTFCMHACRRRHLSLFGNAVQKGLNRWTAFHRCYRVSNYYYTLCCHCVVGGGGGGGGSHVWQRIVMQYST